jgi:hypothetical protein
VREVPAVRVAVMVGVGVGVNVALVGCGRSRLVRSIGPSV